LTQIKPISTEFIQKALADLSFLIKSNLREPLLNLSHPRLAAVHGLLYLWYGDWEQAHACVQTFEGQADCDWVHAFVHRVEGDADNAVYWCKRAGRFPAGAQVAEEAQHLNLNPQHTWQKKALAGAWDPVNFSRRILESPSPSHPSHESERQNLILWQAAEWRGLMAYWLT
jgi:hypothetical protein